MEIRTIDRDFSGSVESLWEKIQRDPVDSDVAVIILKIHNPAIMTDRKSYELMLWGKTLTQWLKLAFDTCPVTEVVCDMGSDILSTIRPHLGEKKYTAVFYCDSPLLQRKTFLNILDWVQTKKLNVCKLERGFVFVTDYIRTAEKIYAATEPHDFGKEDFFTVFNLQQLHGAGQILRNRILNFHQQNGVQIVDAATTFIDADVTIGANVTLFPNTVLMGQCEIGDNVTVEPFCTIKSSKIGNGATLASCYIESSEIAEKAQVKPFTTIIGGVTKKR